MSKYVPFNAREDKKWSDVHCKTSHFFHSGYQNTITVWGPFIELSIINHNSSRPFTTSKRYTFHLEGNDTDGNLNRYNFWDCQTINNALFLGQCFALANLDTKEQVLAQCDQASRLKALKNYAKQCDPNNGKLSTISPA